MGKSADLASRAKAAVEYISSAMPELLKKERRCTSCERICDVSEFNDNGNFVTFEVFAPKKLLLKAIAHITDEDFFCNQCMKNLCKDFSTNAEWKEFIKIGLKHQGGLNESRIIEVMKNMEYAFFIPALLSLEEEVTRIKSGTFSSKLLAMTKEHR